MKSTPARWRAYLACLEIAALLTLGGCRKEPVHPPPGSGEAVKAASYRCPMHPAIIQDRPGDCPICGMDLEPERTSGSASATMVKVDPAMVQNIGVRTQAVTRRLMKSELRLSGKVTVDESRIRSVTTRVSGYVDELRAPITGQRVTAGSTLIELFSPDLVPLLRQGLESSRSLDTIRKNPSLAYLEESARSNLAAARTGLKTLDIPDSVLARIEKDLVLPRTVPILAPISGVLMRKNIVEGQSVQAGAELFQIVDLSRVWVLARVFQGDLASVRVGAPARIRFRNLPGKEFASRVFLIGPEMDAATRTAEVRLQLANTPDLDFRPEMVAEVTLEGMDSDSLLAVPEQSVIRSGNRDIAVISLGGGRFQPREVVLGRSAEGFVEVLEGLEAGDSLVVSAQFLIDSESNLAAAVEQLKAPGRVADDSSHAP